MASKTFIDYLQEVHAKQYVGFDDEMPDDFDDWISHLDSHEMFEYAEACIKEIQK